jgi:hypothetical protein
MDSHIQLGEELVQEVSAYLPVSCLESFCDQFQVVVMLLDGITQFRLLVDFNSPSKGLLFPKNAPPVTCIRRHKTTRPNKAFFHRYRRAWTCRFT